MLSYRKIKHKNFAPLIWQKESELPRWFQRASHVWTPDYESFEKFYNECSEVWGLFDDDRLAAVVYLEIEGEKVNIHVSVLERLPAEKIVRFFRSLVRYKHAEGLRDMRAWILQKNRALLKIARETGFFETGLRMDFGGFRWLELTRTKLY